MPKLISKATKQLLQVEDKHYSADVAAYFTIGFTGTRARVRSLDDTALILHQHQVFRYYMRADKDR